MCVLDFIEKYLLFGKPDCIFTEEEIREHEDFKLSFED